ncbi:hypothetical protein A9Q78_00635 [Methylophaga sp. 41_12_T18]|nr:hypothetical protein A9Q78_00635 [Methylophaga sp. 41_12_T18]
MQVVKTRAFSALLLLSSCALSVPVYAVDEAKPINISIATQPLNQAVTELAIQSGLHIGGNAALLANKQAPALNGSYTVEQALTELLKGCGISYRFTAKDTITLEKKKVQKESETIVLDPVEVTGTTINNRYTVNTASSATGIDASIFDTPRSIQVVNQQIIIEQQAQDLRDVLRNVSGIQTIASSGNTVDTFLLRGVNSDGEIYQNGFANNGNAIRVQTANIERVEVLKGPGALLFGQSSPGGIINVITKKPQEEAFNSINTHFDEHGQRRVEVDSTGSLNDSGTLLYRLVGSLEESETFRKTDKNDRVSRDLIAPSLTWKINENSTLNASYEWIDSSLPRARGTVLVEDLNGNVDFADVPRSRRFGDPGDSSDTIQSTTTLDFNHVFKNDWQLDAGFVYQSNNSNTLNVNAAAGIGPTNALLPGVTNVILGFSGVNFNAVPASGDLVRIVNQFSNKSDSYYGSLRLTGDVLWGKVEHSFITGLDYNHRETKIDNSQPFLTREEALGPIGATGLAPVGSIFSQLNIFNIFNSVYGAEANSFTTLSETDSVDKQLGLYAQDVITFTDEWKLAVGLRIDRFERDSVNTSYLTALSGQLSQVGYTRDTTKQELGQDAFYEASPNAGLIFQPTEHVSIYASYSETFQPNEQSINTQTGQTENIDPSLGEQYEIGVKTAFLNDRLNVNLAYFDITRGNVPAGTDTFSNVTLVNGEEISRGIELDGSMQFLNGFNLLFSYAYLDTEITEDENNEGNRVRGVPKHSASLWGSYEFDQGAFNGLGLAGGAVYVGDTYNDSDNTLELSSHTTFDVTAFYTMKVASDKHLRLQAGVKNLTDKDYHVASNGSLDIGVGIPRTVYGSIGLEF